MNKISPRLLISFILIILTSACAPGWEITLTAENLPDQTISIQDVTFYLKKSTEEINKLPLGQMLYEVGFSIIDTISLTLEDGSRKSFVWDEIARLTTISETGTVSIKGTEYSPTDILVNPSFTAETAQYSIMDIAPTLANALGLPDIPESSGTNRYEGTAEHGVMILLDGTQFQKLQQMINDGKLPFLQQHKNEIELGATVYPPITTAATAALLTSSPPKVNGVYGYGYRSTKTNTLFDLAADAGRSTIAVEGASLSFNLRNAETILSGDRDGNGFSDDNVFKNSLDIIQSGLPDLLFIHFHEIDDMGHSFGPDSPEYEQALIRVDSYLTKIYEALPEKTLLAIFADHGMHETDNGGDHGTLTAEDLIIPIIFIKK